MARVLSSLLASFELLLEVLRKNAATYWTYTKYEMHCARVSTPNFEDRTEARRVRQLASRWLRKCYVQKLMTNELIFVVMSSVLAERCFRVIEKGRKWLVKNRTGPGRVVSE